jgi:Nucleotidyl transferase AbiEii toxin, Type IV TA system
MQFDEVMRILASFEREQLEYVLVGGAALNVHGLIRTTEDVDVFIRPTAENVERLRRALRAVYNDPNVDEISTEDLLGDYPAVRYYPPEGELFLDILTRLGEFASFDDIEAQEVVWKGIKVRIASPRALYWMKKDTVRPIDRSDAQRLRERFGLDEFDR